jgi:hypothetical protein
LGYKLKRLIPAIPASAGGLLKVPNTSSRGVRPRDEDPGHCHLSSVGESFILFVCLQPAFSLRRNAVREVLTQKDGVALGLACGHPHIQAGERCPLCGTDLPPVDKETENAESQEQPH